MWIASGFACNISCKSRQLSPGFTHAERGLWNSYYQVIMMIDIFQYSNMYTVKPVIQKMSRDSSVSEECGLYVTRPGKYFLSIERLNSLTGVLS